MLTGHKDGVKNINSVQTAKALVGAGFDGVVSGLDDTTSTTCITMAHT